MKLFDDCIGIGGERERTGVIWVPYCSEINSLGSARSSRMRPCSGTRWSSDFLCDTERCNGWAWWEGAYELKGCSFQSIITLLSRRDSEGRVRGRTVPLELEANGMLPVLRWEAEPLEFVRAIAGADRWERDLEMAAASARS